MLKDRSDLKLEQLERTRSLMNAHVPDCLVTGYENLIDGLSLPDPDDRHVLAAAIRGSASVIVTFNLDDYPLDYIGKFGIEAQHPDKFVTRLIDLAPAAVRAAAKRHRSSLKNPSKTVDEYLGTLANQRLPETASRLREFRQVI